MELRERIKRHWSVYREEFYANLESRGVLEEAITRVISLADLDVEELVQTGMERGDAESLIYSEFIFAQPESELHETDHWLLSVLSESRVIPIS